MKRILITGSRTWRWYKRMKRVLLDHGPGLVIHGGARGADLMAARIAVSAGWPAPEAHEAAWTHGGAGFERNQTMVDAGADICLAFPNGRASGTRDCAMRAQLAGIPVVITSAP